jgi:hypothetical protein
VVVVVLEAGGVWHGTGKEQVYHVAVRVETLLIREGGVPCQCSNSEALYRHLLPHSRHKL